MVGETNFSAVNTSGGPLLGFQLYYNTIGHLLAPQSFPLEIPDILGGNTDSSNLLVSTPKAHISCVEAFKIGNGMCLFMLVVPHFSLPLPCYMRSKHMQTMYT